ncbi:hypothetical protein [Desulforamulus aquiferis]|uniref:Uncharacterized protein n=1 Tax=Desulforamulus aquiferis TaxID=1397668 RepID=A0AAW7ZDC1_9FIRM|nr:hypothetical protein [Desulforamulus aquiferis]MDO7787239.1 hypothetical protein [Desulforamulus aquiferis]
MFVATEEELASAIKNKEDQITIEGDLKEKTIKIKATGNIAWGVVVTGLIIGVGIIITTGGAGAPISALAGSGAVGILGNATAISALKIGVAAKGVNVLNSLRNDYNITFEDKDKLILKRN